MNRTIILALGLALCCQQGFGSTPTGGTIFFEDGTRQDFYEVLSINHYEGKSDRDGKGHQALHVNMGKEIQELEFRKLKLLEVSLFELKNSRWGVPVLRNVTLKLNISKKPQLVTLDELRNIRVQLLDSKTGSLVRKTYAFNENSSLAIRKITFKASNPNDAVGKVAAANKK